MNTYEVKWPEPTIEEGRFSAFRTTNDADVEERESVGEEAQPAHFDEPDPDYLDWLVGQTRGELPEPGNEELSWREINDLIVRGIRAFDTPISAAEGRARLRRTRQLRVVEARRTSRRLAHAHARRPRSRTTRRSRTRRATTARAAVSDDGPDPASSPAIIAALQERGLLFWLITCPEVGRG
jgi:hypothetical protein